MARRIIILLALAFGLVQLSLATDGKKKITIINNITYCTQKTVDGSCVQKQRGTYVLECPTCANHQYLMTNKRKVILTFNRVAKFKVKHQMSRFSGGCYIQNHGRVVSIGRWHDHPENCDRRR